MPFQKLLIANRGEIAIRIARAAAEMRPCHGRGLSADDALSLHVRAADEALALKGAGRAAYLDIEAGRSRRRRRPAATRCIRAMAS